MGWPEDLSARCADAVGCHHGVRSTPTKIQNIEGDSDRVDGKNWSSVWADLFNDLCNVFHVGDCPKKIDLSGPEFMLLSGLTSFADWIGSNTEWFPFGTTLDCDYLSVWFTRRRNNAEKTLDELGWNYRMPLAEKYKSFIEVFTECNPPRPLQETIEKAIKEIKDGSVILIEAPMGEGKTEASFYAHLELQRRFGHRGLYIAVPTKATGNAMFSRTYKFLKSFTGTHTLDLQLLHGAILLNDAFQKMITNHIHSEESNGGIQASSWFTHNSDL
jgi:CRISPR-associated endonuclease/helicase Cas3